MSETFPRLNASGPAHMPAVSWFEFLLNENLLENHLSDESSDPTASQLIVQFIQQADVHVANLYSGNGQPNNGFSDWKPEASLVDNKQQVKENKKIQALRILALKVAAYLKWDLSYLENGVPLPLVQSLLSELMRICVGGDYELKKSAVDGIDGLSDEALFAIQLYHRWSLKSIVRDSFPAKVAKTGFFQGPAVVEQNIAAMAANEAIVKACKEQQAASLKVLERCAQCGRPLRVPTLHSLGMLNEKTQEVTHNWEKGIMVPFDELKCQIYYDLGAFYFYQENYRKANEYFNQAKCLFETIKAPVFVGLELSRLKGYSTACSTLQAVSQEVSGQMSLIEQAEASKRQFFKGITDILMEDNLRQELPMEYRLDVEEEFIKKKPREKAGIFQLRICNIVRKVLEGRAVLSDLSEDLNKKPTNVEFLMKVLRHAMSGASYGQRSNLKCFVWHILQSLPRDSDFSETLLKSDLRSYFDEDEYSEFSSYEEDDFTFMDDTSYTVGSRSPRSSLSRDSSRLVGGDLERQLICAYDPSLIRHLVKELSYKMGRQASNLLTLNDKWKLPREIQQGLEPLAAGLDKNYISILIAKARHCMELRIFDRSRQLLSKADSFLTQDSTYKLSKHIKWQMVLADLQQFFLNETFPEGSTQQDVAKKAKTCITALRLDQDIQPSQEVLEHCIAFLLNMQDWSYMCNLENTRNGFIEFGRLISCTCKDLPNIKNARKAARDLWDAVLQIFSTNTQHKRSNSGRDSAFHRDSQLGVLSREQFVSFVQKVKDKVILSTLISCLTKFYNALKDDISNDIMSDFLPLWPTALSNTNAVNVSAVADTVVLVMRHAITMHPSEASWLRTQADLHLAHGQHAPAMKFYLESGVVATDFFTETHINLVYDEQVYRRMIKCSSYLQCHTQVAVLCQFLDEVDYATAFKALQERNTYDAMDTYYPFIWDISILEFLIHLHTKRGEMDKRQAALRALNQLDVNSNNPEDILQQAILVRKNRFLQSLSKQYL
ncbi:integrator complex subunit 8-like [Liolophura sinensis]|uniref:integrator complex subunit 8-like n=1 Tax=Liolophura sinensis TaxID=3198878 RepID=UPI00315855E9